MNRRSLAALLAKFDSPHWCSRIIDGTDEKVKWLPIFELAGNRYGITERGGWAGEFADRKRIRPDTFYAAFWAILERKRSDIVRLLKEAIASVELPENVIRTFPFDGVMETALATTSQWLLCAMSWLEEGYPISPGIATLLPEHKLVLRWQKERMDRIIDA